MYWVFNDEQFKVSFNAWTKRKFNESEEPGHSKDGEETEIFLTMENFLLSDEAKPLRGSK